MVAPSSRVPRDRIGGVSDEGSVPAVIRSVEPDISVETLRPALELGFAVAVAGTRLKPAIAAPASLRRYLKFQKLPTGALTPVRRALDDDQAFRERTARVATDELVGVLGRLWLTRPEGWQDRVAELLVVEEVPADDSRPDRSADRRREAAEVALARARADLVVARAELARMHDRVADAETSAAVAIDEAAKLYAEAERLKVSGDRRRERARVAEEDRDRLRRDLAGAADRIAELERLLEEAFAARQDAESPAPSGSMPATTPLASAGSAVGPPAGSVVPVIDGAWLAAGSAIADRLAEAAGALGLLGAEVAAAISALAVRPPAPVVERAAQGPATLRAGGRPDEPTFPPAGVGPRRGGAAGERRRPLPVPGGLLDDSTQVALHLIRQPGVLTLVDGYNLAKLGWPDLLVTAQREFCLDGLEDLVRRYGVRVQVIFDGASVIGRASGRRLVRVGFSPQGVSADDEIRRLVSELPPDRPIVVVTNDREIIRGVRSSGANVVGSEQLLAVMRR